MDKAAEQNATFFRGLLIVSAIIIAGYVAYGQFTGGNNAVGKAPTGDTKYGGMVVIEGQDQFQSLVLGSDDLVVVKFTADWCPPCRQLQPTLEAITADAPDGVTMAYLDTDVRGNGELYQEYNLRGIPTLLFVKGGKEVDRMIGNQSRQAIETKIKQHLS